MARKKKGAALYELLYKDKGRSTAEDGSIKLPTWWKGSAQPPRPGEEPPDDVPTLEQVQAEQERQGQPAPDEPQPAIEPDVEPAPPEPPAPKPEESRPEPSAVEAEEPPVATAVVTPTPRPQRPAAAAPPPPPGRAASQPTSVFTPVGIRRNLDQSPWLTLIDGRVVVNLTQYAALIAALGAVAVLLISFILGYWAAPDTVEVAGPPATVEPGDGASGTIDGAHQDPADPGVLNPGSGSQTQAGQGQIGRRLPGGGMVAGLHYIMIQTFADLNDAWKLQRALDALGHKDITVRQQETSGGGTIYPVRTATGYDWSKPAEKTAAERRIAQLNADLSTLANGELRGTLRYDPNDSGTHPYAHKAR